MRIPTQIAITWHLKSGDFTWYRCKITEVEYNQSGKVTALYVEKGHKRGNVVITVEQQSAM